MKGIFKAGGEQAKVQFCPKSKFVRVQELSPAEEMCVLSTKKAVFRAGDAKEKTGKVQARYATPQNLSRGELAWRLCDELALLSKEYSNFEKKEDAFADMKEDAVFVSQAMRRIAQNLAREPRRGSIYAQNCAHDVESLQKQIMADLRSLQRKAENYSSQILNIYLTVQAQNETTQMINR